MTATYKWHEAYKSAVLETDWSKMEERIRAAESAIAERRSELAQHHGGTSEERHAMDDALRSLSVLRADVRSWCQEKSQRTGEGTTADGVKPAYRGSFGQISKDLDRGRDRMDSAESTATIISSSLMVMMSFLRDSLY